jgi:hypothetical protein
VTRPRAPAARPANIAGLAAGHIRFPLLNSPERCRLARAESFRFPQTPPKRPKRRPRRGGCSREASPTRRYPRWLYSKCGEPPVTHRAQPAAHTGYSLAPSGFFTDASAAEGFRGARARRMCSGGAPRNRQYPATP